jgi:hypothetical protein
MLAELIGDYKWFVIDFPLDSANLIRVTLKQ